MSGRSGPAVESLAEEVSRVLDAERREGFADQHLSGGVSAWVRSRLPGLDDPQASVLRRLSRYSELRQATRERLADEVLGSLGELVAGTPPRPAGGPSGAATTGPEGLAAPVETVWGVGKTMTKRLAALDIRTVGDMLRHAPRRYIDRTSIIPVAEAQPGSEVTVLGEVLEIAVRPSRSGRLKLTEATIGDASGQIAAVWFNQPYLERTLRGRHNVAFAGRVEMGPWGRQLSSPEYELDAGRMIHAGRLVPVYPLTSGITQRQLRRWVATVVESHSSLVEDPLPPALRERLEFPASVTAVRSLHFPETQEAARAAAQRLAFDELLIFQLAVLRQRHRWRESEVGQAIRIDRTTLTDFGARLPFELTDDQRKALADILNDLRRPKPMSRLLQGEVGSGKTVVAAGALFAVARDGWQGTMMAPTEVLAEQHARTLRELLDPLGIRVELITGSVPAARKRALWRAVEAGEVHVAVGTQALIQESARFARLNLAVVDEQQRFGVQQRGEIRAKGYNPHLLAMTATPIPRTLALTLYGDLDVSTIRAMPRGRRTVKTRWVAPTKRADAYAFVKEQIAAGRQAFVICPLISESENLQARSAEQESERLAGEVYPELADQIGLLHGRMSGRAKEAVMRGFREGAAKILVSTAVVEVGIDVPNVSVIMIEGAERFGLAQLHQLRGRVGRGPHQSYCLLLSDTTDASENARLRVMQTVHDGFELAERDLELRGPGDIFGTRQSGLLEFRFASILDLETIMLARTEAQAIIGSDPQLTDPQHQGLAKAVQAALARAELS